MKYLNHIISITVIIIVLLLGCKKDSELLIKENFIGRWVQVQVGNYPSLEPYNDPKRFGYEFLDDSVFHFIDDTGVLGVEKYWVDSLLHIQTVRQGVILFTLHYSYQFKTNDKLQLIIINTPTNYTTSVYNRIK